MVYSSLIETIIHLKDSLRCVYKEDCMMKEDYEEVYRVQEHNKDEKIQINTGRMNDFGEEKEKVIKQYLKKKK